MNILKDLLFTMNNESLDIARLSSFMAVATYLGLSIFVAFHNHEFDPVTFGTGWAALSAGSAGWIYARQKYEKEKCDGDPDDSGAE